MRNSPYHGTVLPVKWEKIYVNFAIGFINGRGHPFANTGILDDDISLDGRVVVAVVVVVEDNVRFPQILRWNAYLFYIVVITRVPSQFEVEPTLLEP